MTIPQIIHQIWLQGERAIPVKLRRYSLKWRELNPDFEYILWDNQKIIEDILPKYPDRFRKIYDEYPHLIQRADFGRYLILFLMGGIYVDMDMRPVQHIRDLYLDMCKYEIVFGKINTRLVDRLVFGAVGSSPEGVNNAVIMCSPRSNAMAEIITECSLMFKSRWRYVNNQIYIQKSTGPGLIGKVIQRPKFTRCVKLLDSKYFEPCTTVETVRGECLPDLTTAVAVHDYDMSWFGKSIILVKLYSRGAEISFVIIVIVCLVLIYKRRSVT
jgi:mannosyltransferase OCH1-like enzyme